MWTKENIPDQSGKTVIVTGANTTELSRYKSREEHAAGIQRVGPLMDPWQGASPSLYAAASNETYGGKLYGPDKDGGYRGYPAEATITTNALDEAVAKNFGALLSRQQGFIFRKPDNSTFYCPFVFAKELIGFINYRLLKIKKELVGS